MSRDYKRIFSTQVIKAEEEALKFRDTIWFLEEKIVELEQLCKNNGIDTTLVKKRCEERKLLFKDYKPSTILSSHIRLAYTYKVTDPNPSTLYDKDKEEILSVIKDMEDKGINDRYTKFLKDFVSKF